MADTSALQDRLAKFEAALDAILLNKSYTIGNKTYTRADENWLTKQIEILESRIYRRSGGVSRAEHIFVPNR